MITEKMSSKSFGLFALSILALVFVMGIGSAASLSITNINFPASVNQNVGSFQITFNLTNSGEAANISWANSSVSGGSATFSSFSVNSIANGSGTPVSETVTVVVGFSTSFTGTISGTIVADPSGLGNSQSFNFSTQITQAPTLTEPTICADGGVSTNRGQLDVNIRDVTVIDGFGDNKEWLLFDEVEVEIRVETGDYDVDDISLEWAIANDDLTDFAFDWDEIDEFNLKDEDEDTFTVTFKVDDDDLDLDFDQLSGLDYNFVVRATGTIDDNVDNDGVDLDKQKTCAADLDEISIQDEPNFVILNNFNIPETVQCGATVDVTADVWNIGDSQQDEVSVDVFDRDRKLIDDLFEVGDIDEFDNTELSFNFEIPSNVEEKTYVLIFRVLDEDSDIFENDFDDDPAEFTFPLTVSGGCTAGAGEVSVSANIVSGGRAGQELVVRATVTNTGTSQKTYSLSVAGFEDWASSFSLDQNALALDAGQSKDVSVTLDVNDDAAGSRTFFLEFLSGGEVVRQPVSVSVGEARGGFLGITGSVINSDNWYLWGIGLLNVLLVVVIIFVAVRIARKK